MVVEPGDAPRHAALQGYNQQLWYEQELDKIRTEGDIALVSAQSERAQIAEADALLKDLQRQLREKKKQFAKIAISAGSGIVGDSAALEQVSRRHEQVRMQLEERLKAAISAKTTELQQLRHQIDEERRLRLDGLQSEKRVVEETQRMNDAIKQSQAEVELLKEKAGRLKTEIAQLQAEFDSEKTIFRLERQQLQLDLDRIARPEKEAVKVKVLGRKFTVFRSMETSRKKRDAMTRAKKLSLDHKVVSFEQKKASMDRLVVECKVPTLDQFIELYNQQEREKAEMMERIEAKSLMNSSTKELIAKLEEDITRLSGAGDIQSIVGQEQPGEIKKKIDADESLISHWTSETHAFQEALKSFRDPVRDLYMELFPHEREDESFDSTINEVTMLRRLGAIEERVMQRVLLKISREAEESSNSSETLKRLQRYRGSLRPAADQPAVSSSLVVAVPSLRDGVAASNSDDEDEDGLNGPVVAIRSDDCRPKKPALHPGAPQSPHMATH